MEVSADPEKNNGIKKSSQLGLVLRKRKRKKNIFVMGVPKVLSERLTYTLGQKIIGASAIKVGIHQAVSGMGCLNICWFL